MREKYRLFSGFIILLLALSLILSQTEIAFSEDEAPKDTEADISNAVQTLYKYGILKDNDPKFDPDGIPILEEAVMLAVRLAGKEQEALEGTWDQPYKGVTEAAAPYVGYAEAAGMLTDAVNLWYGMGNSESPFGVENDHVYAAQCLDIVLHVLGYSSEDYEQPDYPWFFSDHLGLTRAHQYWQSWEPDFVFSRGNMAVIMANALRYRIKGTDKTLLQNLLENRKVPGMGTVRVTSAPGGADVMVDGEFSGRTAPCTLILPEGEHEISLKIPGYTSESEIVTVAAGTEPSVEKRLVPDLPEARVIAVNTEKDVSNEDQDLLASVTADTLPKQVSLRIAIAAVNNDPTDQMYRIEFAKNVKRIAPDRHIIYATRGNLIINGDRNEDGVPDVTLSQTDWCFHFRPMKNLYLVGLAFDGGVVNIGPDHDESEDGTCENIYLLGCTIRADLFNLAGSGKSYNGKGTVNFINFNVCGCDIGDSNLFYTYVGNTDNSITDGLRYCANTLTKEGYLSIQVADCNTWYIYGRDTEKGNGGTPGQFEICEDNIIRNILVSGNTGGGMVIAAGTGGNQRNLLENMTVRNNVFTREVHIRAAQMFDDSNEGNTLDTSGNTISDLCFRDNVIDNQTNPMSTYFADVAAGDVEYDPSSTIIASDNVIRNLSFIGNRYYWGDRDVGPQWIEEGIDYTLESGEIVVDLQHDRHYNMAPYQGENNRYEGILFAKNWMTTDPYNPYTPYE